MQHGPKFVGLYWTLPVSVYGFTYLPRDIDEACLWSRTIRYQRELARLHARDEGGNLVGEVASIEVEDDRAGRYDVIMPRFHEAAEMCREAGATLLTVDFKERRYWRSHRLLDDQLANADFSCRQLSPNPVVIDGYLFDAIAHFEAWRFMQTYLLRQKGTLETRRRNLLRQVLECAGERLPPFTKPGDYVGAVELLATAGVKTLYGRGFTAANLRIFVKQHSWSEEDAARPEA